MSLNISDKHIIENVRIENNIVKGVDVDVIENPNIGQMIIDTLNRQLDHVAQIEVDTDKKITFADMKDKSIRCALWLQNHDIASGDTITICTDNHSDVYVPLFAGFYLGATVNGWDHVISLKSAQDLMKFLKPKVIFSCESAADTLLEAAKLEKIDITIIVFGKHSTLKSFDEILKNQANNQVTSFQPRKIEDPNAIALIVLTSGSTSAPKGVMHSYKNVTLSIQTFFGQPFKDIALWYSTVYWITGVFMLLQSFFSLGTRIIHKAWDVDDSCKVIQKYKVQRLFAPPTMFNYLSKSNALAKYDLGSLKYVVTGGSKISPHILEELKKKLPKASVVQTYGISEACRAITEQANTSKNLNSVGFPLPNCQIKIIDPKTHESLGVDQSGEICAKLPCLMLGYCNNLEETKKAIDEEGWLHTGDEGFYDSNGEITIIGRFKDLIKCCNFAILPSDLEDVLMSHPAVLEAAVVPIPHNIDVERPIAFVKTKSTVSEEELVKMTLTLGENRKLRGGVVFLDELPKLPAGKINKQQLKKMALALAEKRDFQK